MTGGAGQDDDADVNSLINAIRTVAREDEKEVASLPAEAAPLLSEATRARITEQILGAQARIRNGHSRPSRNRPRTSMAGVRMRSACGARRARGPGNPSS